MLSFACMCGCSVCVCLCVCVFWGDSKAGNDSEWRANPSGYIAESNSNYQNLIISIIIFIIFIHFLSVRLNAASLLSHCLCALIYFSLCCSLSTGDMWGCQSCWLTALKWPTEKRLIFSFFFFFFLVRRRSAVAGALSGNPIYCSFSGRKGLSLTLTDSSQICQLQCRDFL